MEVGALGFASAMVSPAFVSSPQPQASDGSSSSSGLLCSGSPGFSSWGPSSSPHPQASVPSSSPSLGSCSAPGSSACLAASSSPSSHAPQPWSSTSVVAPFAASCWPWDRDTTCLSTLSTLVDAPRPGIKVSFSGHSVHRWVIRLERV